MPAKLQLVVEAAAQAEAPSHAVLPPSAFDNKQATGHDVAPNDVGDLFSGVRPSIVVGEASTEATFAQEVVVEQAFNKVTGMTVPMGDKFEPQFEASYMPRSVPWALNYSCGGADFPGLFTDWTGSSLKVRPRQKGLQLQSHGVERMRRRCFSQVLMRRCWRRDPKCR